MPGGIRDVDTGAVRKRRDFRMAYQCQRSPARSIWGAS
jgi:hypothetical protein